MIIRPLTSEDFVQAAQLHAKLFRNWELWSAADFERYAPRVNMLGAYKDNILLGFIIGRQLSNYEADAVTFAVEPQLQNTGIGGRLLQAMIAFYSQKNIEHFFLEVATDNVAAIHLYRKFGFDVTGHRPAYYDHGQGKIDGLVMRLALEPIENYSE